MRRAVLTLGSTVAGLAALFSFRTHVPGITPVAATSTPTGLSVSAPPSPTVSAPASASASPSKTAKKTAPKESSSPTATRTHPATPTASAPTTAPATTAPSKKPATTPTTQAPTKSSAPSGDFTGSDESTNYGDVQVQITVANGKITAANDVQQPSDSIGSNAVSQLNSEVLTAQSANIQAVSGATYTSNGYIQSLQSAVDQAGL
jgi:uncharacterized protein with FMN-binding domain